KILFLHHRFPQKSTLYETFLEGFGVHHLHKKDSVHAGWRGFAGPTKYSVFRLQRSTSKSLTCEAFFMAMSRRPAL
ncbi:MAG: hypothetical protein Q7R66_05630, partial [Undibacterium sp.]|uniref:hypothetical protein n=1 Tax=Undibacterium sp. TaxID=1914977 RepID=UPI0027212AD7